MVAHTRKNVDVRNLALDATNYFADCADCAVYGHGADFDYIWPPQPE